MKFKEVLESSNVNEYIETVTNNEVHQVHIDSIVDYVDNAPKIVQEKIVEQLEMIRDKEGAENYLSQLAEGL